MLRALAMLLPCSMLACGVDLPEPAQLPAAQLLAHWPLNEGAGMSAADRTGSHHGSLAGGVTWVEADGRRALRFDGDDERVELGTLDIESSQLTLMAWVRLSSENPVLENRIISKAYGAGPDKHYWLLGLDENATSHLRFRLKTSAGEAITVNLDGDRPLPQNAWVHVCATYDGALMRLYQNGVLDGATSQSGPVATASNVQAWIGSNPEIYRTFVGEIADVRIYGRALSEEEIAAVAWQ